MAERRLKNPVKAKGKYLGKVANMYIYVYLFLHFIALFEWHVSWWD